MNRHVCAPQRSCWLVLFAVTLMACAHEKAGDSVPRPVAPVPSPRRDAANEPQTPDVFAEPEPKPAVRCSVINPSDRVLLLENNEVAIVHLIGFTPGSPSLMPGEASHLDWIAAFLQSHGEMTLIRIEVDSYEWLIPSANQDLSERRAKTVWRALIQRGVDKRRLMMQGFGSSRPANHVDAARFVVVTREDCPP